MKTYEYVSHIVKQIAGEILPRQFDYMEFYNDVRWDCFASGWNTGNIRADNIYDLNGEDPEQKSNKFFYYDTVLSKWIHSNTKLYVNTKVMPLEIYDHSFEPIYYELDNTLWNPPDKLILNDFKKYKYIVLHSEISPDIKILENIGWRPVYWFSHAYLCSAFYFNHYKKLKLVTDYKSRPIVYPWISVNRLLRDYRVEFLNKIDYTKGMYSLLAEDDTGKRLWGNVPPKSFDNHGNHSAEICVDKLTPWNTSFLHIVMETIWQDKIHFTEKVFKPIVLHQPFVVLQAPGSLEYLRSYGFKTFGDWWDESYDSIEDPEERMNAIAKIVDWVVTQDQYKMREEMSGVLEHNFRHFYENIPDIVLDELRVNLKNAV